jgi:hypothetical protein
MKKDSTNNREENHTGTKAPRTTKPLAERPLQMDEMRLENLAMAGLSDEQIAATLKVPLCNLQRDYGEKIQQARLRGLGMLWRKAFEMAVVQGDQKMLTFLLCKRDAVEADPQVLELRALEIRERRLRLEQLETSREQQIFARRQLEDLARLDAMGMAELHGEMAKNLLDAKLGAMERERRQVILQALLQPGACCRAEDAECQLMLMLFRTLGPQHKEQLLRSYDVKAPAAVQG